MEDGNRLPITLTKSIAATICVLILTLGGCQIHRDRLFALNGYEETTLPGSNEKAWKKMK